ncbi:MAG TPA: hypothetical protein VEH09_12545 [Thermodesulfobacteriota bacterium]|nr:hypothetical protein [Thermodesulfobacteriota bacterium]
MHQKTKPLMGAGIYFLTAAEKKHYYNNISRKEFRFGTKTSRKALEAYAAFLFASILTFAL